LLDEAASPTPCCKFVIAASESFATQDFAGLAAMSAALDPGISGFRGEGLPTNFAQGFFRFNNDLSVMRGRGLGNPCAAGISGT
jgi:hypothetical protein